jgi:LmbE family N-acetylglucosaminyl deacetylase
MRLDELPMKILIDGISDVFKKLEPNIIYMPFKGDVHTDHKIVFQAAYASTKGFRYP